jgi:hypothetical protein
MKIVQFLLNLLRMLFGGRKAALPEAETREEKPAETEAVDAEENAPKTDDAAEGLEGDGVSDATEEPEDEPQDDFDDVEYDVEHETEDDDTEREPLPEPDPDTVERVERKIAPSPEWRNRQRWLKDLGYDPGPVDGKPGRRTQGALKEFQSDRGLLPDGVWGPKTQAAMVAALKDKEDAEKPRVPPPPSVSRPPSTEPASSVPGAYEDMIGDVELDDGFWASFVDLTSKSNVKDGNGRRLLAPDRLHLEDLPRAQGFQVVVEPPQDQLARLRGHGRHHPADPQLPLLPVDGEQLQHGLPLLRDHGQLRGGARDGQLVPT